jgi:regulator of sirC expression with transglutaminase-like and TPR domain
MQPQTLTAVLAAAQLDERCGRFSDVVAMDALSNGDFAEADRASAQSVRFDPLAAQPWMIRAQVLTAMQDKSGALAALDMAAAAVAISPQAQGDGSGEISKQIQSLRDAANAIP